MTTEPDRKESPPPEKTHAGLWILLTIFIFLAIGGMWAIDYYYSPEAIDSKMLPEAVGK